MCEVQRGQKVKRGEKHIQSMEKSENPFIPRDRVTALTLTKMIFNNELGGGDTQRGRELEKEREGENLSLKESIINTLVEIRGKGWLCSALE